MPFKTQDAEVSPSGGKVSIGYFCDSFETHTLFYGLVGRGVFIIGTSRLVPTQQSSYWMIKTGAGCRAGAVH